MYILPKISIKPFPGLRPKTFATLFLLAFVIQQCFSQIMDDFADGDFTANPSWRGTTTDFTINSNQLQLNAAVAGTSYLYIDLPSPDIGDFEWQFYVRQSFSPSGGNFGRVYLMSDRPDFTGPLNGYYVQFGEAGSLDAVALFRQSGTESVSICRGRDGAISTPFVLKVKIIRSQEGKWQLYTNYAGGSDLALEASGVDAAFSSSAYSGILCTYTITNATRFYYDDFSLRQVALPDISAPRVIAVNPTSSHTLDVIFSEKIDRIGAENPINYSCPALLANPVSATLDSAQKTVHLSFSKPFKNGEQATLTVDSIKDISGNALEEVEMAFLYFQPAPVQFRDIIMTEIFPDPVPRVGLPSSEFVELYNRSPNPVQLEGWSFSDGASTARLSAFILLPEKYLVLCDGQSLAQFSETGTALSVSDFPTLNNGSDALKLSDVNGIIIDSVHYSSSWYKDDDKAEGGWSLELIDLQNVCADASNWTGAEALTGGTPGGQNSVYANKPDNTGPSLISVFPADSITLMVVFNEKLENVIPDVENFTIEPFLNINGVTFSDGTLTMLTLLLSQPMNASVDYQFEVKNVYDCAGNRLRDELSRAHFVLPEPALRGDVVINEILSNPRPTGVDFIEVFNRSHKTIDLNKWAISNPESSAGATGFLVAKEVFLLHPGAYRVFSEDINVLKGEYVMGKEENFTESRLPPFNDDGGLVVLIDGKGSTIDSIHYSAGMHSPFVSDPEGVSLERISPNADGTAPSNWRSASSLAGSATPGYVNSNLRPEGLSPGAVTVDPEILQPDVNDRSFALIKYHFERGGFVANVRIFDQQGHSVRELARDELLGTEGFFRWEGDQDNGTRAGTGYYMIWFQVFDTTGMLETFRRRIALY